MLLLVSSSFHRLNFSPKGDVECRTTVYSGPALTYTGGHTPVGFYAMGKLRYNDRVYNHPWYNLYPRKKDDSGWWDYAAYNVETLKSAIGLHRGNATTRGWGCVTVPDNDCWAKLEYVVNSYQSTETITATFHDIVIPVDTEVKAEVIGRLTIVD